MVSGLPTALTGPIVVSGAQVGMMDGVDQSLVSIDVIALRFGNPEPGQLRFAVSRRGK